MRIRPFPKYLHIRSVLGFTLLIAAFEATNARTETATQPNALSTNQEHILNPTGKQPNVFQKTPDTTSPKAAHLDNFGGHEVSLGKPTAPLTIIMYYSLTCPHCHDFHKHQLPKIEKDFIDKGLVRFIFRDFPTDSFAIKAAKIAWCHGTKQYLYFAQKLLETQSRWVPTDVTKLKEAEDALHEIATKELWISDENYHKCLANQNIETSILRSSFEAQKTYEIMGAPTFLINGEVYEGILSHEAVEKKLFDMKIFMNNHAIPAAPAA